MALKAKEAIQAIEGTGRWGKPDGSPNPSGGIVTAICRRLNVSRPTFYTLMKKSPTVRDALDNEREGMKDMAESSLMRQIQDGNTTATIFYLKTQARDRGYVERVQVDDWQTEIVDALRNGQVKPEDIQLLYPDLAGEFFSRAGVKAGRN
jgi:hypothetical protein